MPQTLSTLPRQLLLILLALFGAGQVSAFAEDDPLIGLIDGLRGDRIEPVETWLQVLSDQIPNTVTTLVKVLREDGETELLGKLEPQLREVIIQATLQHTSGPQDPVIWEQHCRVSMEIVGVLGESPEARNLLLLLKSPKSAPTGTYNVRPFQRALRDCLLQACDRDESTLRVIQRVYGTQTRALDSQLLRILGDCDAPSTPDTLARCLGKRRNFDGIVLTQIAGALRKPHLRITEFALGSVRPLLEDSTPLTRQSAARALGYADDTESIRPLILLLKDPSDSVRNETLKALHRITAMTIEGHPDRWLIWFDEETHWWVNDAAATLQSLRDST
ncbi:MAG: HEAT repeat domain-containing protein, partial [Planctomycetota bacterium]|nr:HEAT repeat domain-containing protein [Planctomycetota bacterium]